MLIALAGHVTGYDGSELYARPADPFNSSHYVALRQSSALVGAASVPLVYGICWTLSGSVLASSLGATLVAFGKTGKVLFGSISIQLRHISYTLCDRECGQLHPRMHLAEPHSIRQNIVVIENS